MHCISSFPTFLTISGFNGSPVFLSLNSWHCQGATANPAPPESAQPPLLRLSAVDLVPSFPVLRRVPRLACSVAKHAVSLPPTVWDTFLKISLCRPTIGCDRVHQNIVCSRLRDVLIIRHEPCGLVPRSPRYQPKSFQTGTDRIEHSACHQSTSASTSTAPPTPPRDTQRERVHLARFAILLGRMQTPSDVCPAPAVLPTRLAWRVAVERERQAHGT